MALDDSPWVFRFDNKWFVSELPARKHSPNSRLSAPGIPRTPA